MDSKINSKEYWDERFGSGDWQDKGGHKQTTYFYTLLLELTPNVIKEKFNTSGFTICDVGCAEGDGTSLLNKTFPKASVCGMDISEMAIKKAKKRYQNINFRTMLDSKYNLIVSSNTLEHFDEPSEHLKELFRCSDEYVVLLVPFEEYDRIDEHFFTFTYEYFKLKYEDFSLVFVNEIESDERFWNGKQLLLIFQKNIKAENLTLKTVGVASLLSSREKIILENISALKNKNYVIEEKKLQLQDKEQEFQEKEQQIHEKEKQLQNKEQQLQDKEQENIVLKNKVADLVEMVESMRIKNRVKRVIKKIVPLNNNQAKEVTKKTIKLLAGEKNYTKLKNIYNQKQMNIDCHTKLVREINFELDKVLYVFPVIDWSFRIQRPQHIASQFRNDGYKVIYFSTTFHISKKPGYFLSEIEEGILNITLFLDENKNIYKDALNQKNINFLLLSILKLEKELFINKRISIIDHPFWFDIADNLSGAFTIYDCMDYHEGFGDDSKYLVELEHVAMTRSDLLILSSQDLYERFSKKNKNAILVRNGCEFSYFNTKPQLVHNNSTKKQIGYYGAISSWFDADLVIELAKYYSDYDFILIGTVHECDNIQGLKAMDNITLIGEVPYHELTKYLYSFDVCIMPFKVNELTYATNPVKVYEYLASGKPVVSTLLPEVVMMGDVVGTAKNTEEFIAKIDEAISDDSNQKQLERINFSKSNDWISCYKVIAKKINEVKLSPPKVSIVILTYNNLDFTKNCLVSMERFNNYENCEVIIVDNLSSDGTREYLTEYEQSRENIKVILHDENSGFAGGNNIGIKASSGDYVILLNNDTYVTPNWIVNLLKHFSDDKIAMVGPRTNNIGNESRIDSKYNSLDEMILKSYDIYYENVLKQYEMEVLAFFCVVIKREIIGKIGLLDEIYTIGMFEDDDYCRKVKSAGYRLVCADDVFIHHHLGASFDKDPEWKEKLFKKNKAIFESRYGEWIPHKYRLQDI